MKLYTDLFCGLNETRSKYQHLFFVLVLILVQLLAMCVSGETLLTSSYASSPFPYQPIRGVNNEIEYTTNET
jgi:hypothetical protein